MCGVGLPADTGSPPRQHWQNEHAAGRNQTCGVFHAVPGCWQAPGAVTDMHVDLLWRTTRRKKKTSSQEGSLCIWLKQPCRTGHEPKVFCCVTSAAQGHVWQACFKFVCGIGKQCLGCLLISCQDFLFRVSILLIVLGRKVYVVERVQKTAQVLKAYCAGLGTMHCEPWLPQEAPSSAGHELRTEVNATHAAWPHMSYHQY